jgi:hypothetical protein
MLGPLVWLVRWFLLLNVINLSHNILVLQERLPRSAGKSIQPLRRCAPILR